ncbi:hypothetical protein L596_007855 [Steinernema carpocapsae]|uniref:Uncharacterized protein n=1 Tax=Steinernema carpocapsae TaxID=34508 RepID=A0A4U5PAR2_STECR|nr:hypothetical protein L596_007855 [Steinernema carpocapsae]
MDDVFDEILNGPIHLQVMQREVRKRRGRVWFARCQRSVIVVTEKCSERISARSANNHAVFAASRLIAATRTESRLAESWSDCSVDTARSSRSLVEIHFFVNVVEQMNESGRENDERRRLYPANPRRSRRLAAAVCGLLESGIQRITFQQPPIDREGSWQFARWSQREGETELAGFAKCRR